MRTADKKSLNISTLAAGGYANAAAQVAFCDAEAAAAAPQPAAAGSGPVQPKPFSRLVLCGRTLKTTGPPRVALSLQ